MNTTEKSIKLTKKELDLHIAKSSFADSQLTDKWLRENGLNPNYFSVTDYKLLKAQQRANECLKNHEALLTQSEKKTLVRFNTKMNIGHIRKKLTSKAAKTILDLTSRIRRRAYRMAQIH
jgi:hypothetical protein